MRKPEYKTYKNKKDNVVEITVLVPSYQSTPEGTQEDWIKYVKEQKERYGFDVVKLFRESEDKQTGYTSTYFVCDII